MIHTGSRSHPAMFCQYCTLRLSYKSGESVNAIVTSLGKYQGMNDRLGAHLPLLSGMMSFMTTDDMMKNKDMVNKGVKSNQICDHVPVTHL